MAKFAAHVEAVLTRQEISSRIKSKDAERASAEALGMGDRIGSIGPCLDADLVAVDGNPLDDITAVRRVIRVMRGGKVVVNLRRN